jgi:hypothetical protein
MWLLQEVQTGEAWELPRKQIYFGNRTALNQMNIALKSMRAHIHTYTHTHTHNVSLEMVNPKVTNFDFTVIFYEVHQTTCNYALRMKSSGEHNTDHLIHNFLRVFLLITPHVHTQSSVVPSQSMDLCPPFESWDGTNDNMYITHSSGPPERSTRKQNDRTTYKVS